MYRRVLIKRAGDPETSTCPQSSVADDTRTNGEETTVANTKIKQEEDSSSQSSESNDNLCDKNIYYDLIQFYNIVSIFLFLLLYYSILRYIMSRFNFVQ